MQSLLKDASFGNVSNAATADTTTLAPTVIDMQNYDGLTVIAKTGDVTSGCVLNLKLYEGAVSTGSDSAFPTGGAELGSATAGASDYDSKLLIVDLYRPQKRYVTPQLTRGTQNAVIESITYIRWNGRVKPVTQGSDVKASALATGV